MRCKYESQGSLVLRLAFVKSICSPGQNIVHLVGHAARLGYKAHRARAVQLAGNDVFQSACCVADSESASLKIAKKAI